jgi:hypothetical protein
MDPITAALLLSGTALSGAGGIISQNSALANATAQANARNAVVQKAVNELDQYGANNQNTFSGLMAGYSPKAQAATLASDQANRADTNVAAITADNPNATPIQSDASPATRADLAKRMLAVHDLAVDRAKSQGQLGGYSDVWLGNQIANQQAGNQIGVENNFAEGRKALVQPESDLAAAAAYKPPSIWGPLLAGAGSIMAAAGGRGGPFAGPKGSFDYPDSFAPDITPGVDESLSEAAKAGVQSGLTFNPWTGTIF